MTFRSIISLGFGIENFRLKFSINYIKEWFFLECMGLHTLKNLEKAIDKQFGNKEAHIYYADDLAKKLPETTGLDAKELPGFSIIFSKNGSDKFIISGTDVQAFEFTKEYTPDDVISLIKLTVIQNPIYFNNNHVPIFLNSPEQVKYLDAIRKRFYNVKQYKDAD